MTVTRKTPRPLGPSPLQPGSRIAAHWTVGARWASFGDVHFHGATSEIEVDVAVWRYQGSQPLPKFLEALERDRQRFSDLAHPQICRTFDAGGQPGELTCYWVQESPGGVPLLEHLHERSVVVPDVTVQMALQVALGLDALHRADLVHGDLAPEFVRVLGEDRIKLTWAGLALRLEGAGLDTGRGTARSLAEVAPETLRDGTVDRRSDAYAFAALLYRMLAGVSPFLVRRDGPPPGADPSEALTRLPAGLPPAVLPPLLASLGRNPEKRPTMAEWIDALRTAQAQLGARGSWASEPLPRRDRAPAPAPSVPIAKTPDKGKNLRIDSTIGNVPRSGRTSSPSPARRQSDDGLPPLPSLGIRSTVRPKTAIGATPAPPHPGRPTRGPSLATHLAATSLMALLVLGGVAIMIALGQASDPPPPEPIAAATPTALPAIVTLATHPPGATVWEKGQSIGTTPLEVVFDVQRHREPREFRIDLEGYAAHTVRQPWTEDDKQHDIVLQPLEGPTTRYIPVPAAPSYPQTSPTDRPEEDPGDAVPDPRIER